MGLIRTSKGQTTPGQALVLDLRDVVRQAEQILAEARAQADRIREQAETERQRCVAEAAEPARRQGHAAGFEQGRREGQERGRGEALAESRDRCTKLESAWTQALESLVRQRAIMLAEAREQLVHLAATFAERVTRRAVRLDPSAVAPQLESAVELAGAASRLLISIHPDDEPLVRGMLPKLMSSLPGAPHAELAADPALTRGSCIVKSAAGVIDASIDTQIARMLEILLPGQPVPALPQQGISTDLAMHPPAEVQPGPSKPESKPHSKPKPEPEPKASPEPAPSTPTAAQPASSTAPPAAPDLKITGDAA